MTFREIIDIVLSDIDEPSSDAILIKKIKNYINRGYKELARRECLTKAASKNISNYKIKKPVDCIKIYAAYLDGEVLPFNDEGEYLSFQLISGTVKLVYSFIPDPLIDDGDETETSIAYDEFIINYAKWLFYLNDGLDEEAKMFKIEVESLNVSKQLASFTKTIDVYGVGENV